MVLLILDVINYQGESFQFTFHYGSTYIKTASKHISSRFHLHSTMVLLILWIARYPANDDGIYISIPRYR